MMSYWWTVNSCPPFFMVDKNIKYVILVLALIKRGIKCH
jgi:hypothetical protein